MPGRNSMIAGIILIAIGVALLFVAARAHRASPTVRGMLEGQGTVCVPAGVGILAYGAMRSKNGNGRKNGEGAPKG